MPKFANPLKKSRVLTSTYGHSIEYPGRTPDGLTFVHTPPLMVQAAISAGLASEEELDEPEEKNPNARPTDPTEVKRQLFEAFDLLIETGERESFTAAGTPKANAVEKLTGWSVDNTLLKDSWKAHALQRGEADEDKADRAAAVEAAKKAAK